MGEERLELSQIAPLAPKTSASTISPLALMLSSGWYSSYCMPLENKFQRSANASNMAIKHRDKSFLFPAFPDPPNVTCEADGEKKWA